MRRASVLEAEFPEKLRPVLEKHVALYARLEPDEREKLERLTLLFLAEKNFEGAGGLVLTDEMQAVIAARACLLVLHRIELDDPLYPDLDVVIVYPSAYQVRGAQREGGIVLDEQEVRLGESWTRGMVVLSWDAVRAGGANPKDGHDVVLHEFAHQLDAEDGTVDGAPALGSSSRYKAWASVLGADYADLVDRVERGRKSDLDSYGATNPAEFFAVVTEAFFERPERLQATHPDLYAELAAFYRFDPASRLAT
jgi:MtfA peptidase